jgi:hypothetical protein
LKSDYQEARDNLTLAQALKQAAETGGTVTIPAQRDADR